MLLNVFSTTYIYWWKTINIFSIISRTGMNLWLGYTCNVKSSGKKYKRCEEGECALPWMLCIVDQNHERSVVVPDHFRNFKRHLVDSGHSIESGGVLIRGRGNNCSKFEKGKLKIKKLLKIAIVGTKTWNFFDMPYYMWTQYNTKIILGTC